MSDELNFRNYCACFIDLLGQKEALRGENLFKGFKDDEEENAFIARVKPSIGAIIGLQKNAAHFLKKYPPIILDPDKLNDEEKEEYAEMTAVKMQQQRWSDGLVLFSSMQSRAAMNAIWEIIGTSGCLCLLGLAGAKPLRGGVEISWGVELHQNELYGAVVANSYTLESEVAQYPRIVVGEHMMGYLNAVLTEAPKDKVEEYNHSLADLCLRMITNDVDGYPIIDYLGEIFTESYTKASSKELFSLAYSFASEQLDNHSSRKNTKLAQRYNWLLAYMDARSALHA